MANNGNGNGNGGGIQWFTVAHGALAILTIIIAYMGRVVIENSNRLASIETTAAALDARMDRQLTAINARVDHHENEVTQRMDKRDIEINHQIDKVDSAYSRVEDRLEAQILLLQKASTEAEQRAIQECRSIVSSTRVYSAPTTGNK